MLTAGLLKLQTTISLIFKNLLALMNVLKPHFL